MPHYKLIICLFCVALLSGCNNDDSADSGFSNVEHGNVYIDLSSDGKSVVFSSADGDLFLFDLASKVATRLTETEQIESCPSFSADDKSIVYVAGTGFNSANKIFVMELKSLETTQLTESETTRDLYPRFSKDGKQVLFARSFLHRRYSLGGWTWDNWDVCSLSIGDRKVSRLTNENYYQMNRIVPKLDGSLLFSANPQGPKPSYGLYSLVPKGKLELIIPNESEEDSEIHAWAFEPMLSSDEKSVAFSSDREKPYWYDVCVQSDGKITAGLVGRESNDNRCPDFFPDGKRILFLAGTKSNRGSRSIYSLWEVTLDGMTTEIASDDLFTNPQNWLAK